MLIQTPLSKNRKQGFAKYVLGSARKTCERTALPKTKIPLNEECSERKKLENSGKKDLKENYENSTTHSRGGGRII